VWGSEFTSKDAALQEGSSFWYFWLTIQSTTTSQVRNLFSVVAVFISFPPCLLESAIPAVRPGATRFSCLPKKKKKKRQRKKEEKKRKKEKIKKKNK
jgi:hypothetical protein